MKHFSILLLLMMFNSVELASGLDDRSLHPDKRAFLGVENCPHHLELLNSEEFEELEKVVKTKGISRSTTEIKSYLLNNPNDLRAYRWIVDKIEYFYPKPDKRLVLYREVQSLLYCHSNFDDATKLFGLRIQRKIEALVEMEATLNNSRQAYALKVADLAHKACKKEDGGLGFYLYRRALQLDPLNYDIRTSMKESFWLYDEATLDGTPLFNGDRTTGWTVLTGEWKVQDNCLVALSKQVVKSKKDIKNIKLPSSYSRCLESKKNIRKNSSLIVTISSSFGTSGISSGRGGKLILDSQRGGGDLIVFTFNQSPMIEVFRISREKEGKPELIYRQAFQSVPGVNTGVFKTYDIQMMKQNLKVFVGGELVLAFTFDHMLSDTTLQIVALDDGTAFRHIHVYK